MPQFSVIIPNYNHAPWLKERIESVLAQTCPDYEIILLDDGSTDNSRDILEQYRNHPKVSQLLYNETNSGSPFRQWQKGIGLAKGEWIWIAESDDLALPDFLEKMAGKIRDFPTAGLVYSDAIINEDPETPEKTFAAEKNLFFKTTKWSENYFSDGRDEINSCLGIRCTVNNASSAVLKKELLKDCIDTAAGYRFHGDWYCYLSIAAKADIAYIPLPLNIHRSDTGHVKAGLPPDGKHRVECFRILVQLNRNLLPGIHKKTTRQFIQLNLDLKLLKQSGTLCAYFREDKKWALKVLWQLIKHRIMNRKKAAL